MGKSREGYLGVDARFLSGRLFLYSAGVRELQKWLLQILSVYGLNAPCVNAGNVENKGFLSLVRARKIRIGKVSLMAPSSIFLIIRTLLPRLIKVNGIIL